MGGVGDEPDEFDDPTSWEYIISDDDEHLGEPWPEEGLDPLPPGEARPRQRRPRRRAIENLTRTRRALRNIDEVELNVLDPNSLRRINFERNELTELPESLARFANLTEINVSENALRNLPDAIWSSNYILTVNASHNQLIRLNSGIGRAVELGALNVAHNRLSRLPDEIGDLQNLSYLNASNNILLNLPNALSKLRSLRSLVLSRNEFERFPESILGLQRLESLDLSGNHLRSLPERVGELKRLTNLDLSENNIEYLPSELGELSNLRELNLSNNELETLPKGLGKLSDSILLNLEGNNLEEPYLSLIRRGTKAILTYLRSLEESAPQYEAKLLLVGEGNVGKTSLLAYLRGEEFVKNRSTTHGVELDRLQFTHPSRDVTIQMNSWDFGGQPVYRISHQFFLTKRALYIVVWKPREGIEENQVVGWCRRIVLRVGRQARIVLVATHADERRVDFDSEAIAKQFPGVVIGSFAVSNKTGLGFEDLRHAISREAAKLPQMGEILSNKWVDARKEVMSQGKPYITRIRLERICASHGLDEDATSTFSNLLHDLGYIIHYSEDDGLRDLVVLQPEWLTKAIGFVLEDDETADHGGILEHRRLTSIWSKTPEGEEGYGEEHFPYFLRLMEKFDVSYRLPNGSSSLVAQLVPHTRPVIQWTQRRAGTRSLRTICRLTDEAPGLISWLTVRNSRFSTGHHWRRGLHIEHKAYDSQALIQLSSNNRDLQLNVIGPSPDYFFHVLKDGIEELVEERWAGLGYDFLVPCEQRDRGTDRMCTGYFRHQTLTKFRSRGEENIVCQNCVQWSNVNSLLTGYDSNSTSFQTLLEQIQLTQEATLNRLGRLEQRASESAHNLRIALRILSTEITDCPRLFTLRTENEGAIVRSFSTRHKFRLTLWCEEPGQEHAVHDASYTLKVSKDWLIAVTPYLRFVIGMLKVAVPLYAAVAPLSLPEEVSAGVSDELELSKTLVEQLPDLEDSEELSSGISEDIGRQSAKLAEGSGLRMLREMLLDLDTSRTFGGLRRIVSPSGDVLWVCRNHYSQYDPGLPRL